VRTEHAIVEALVAKAAEVLAVDVSVVLERSHRHIPSRARAACYQALREVPWTYSQIGAAFDRDHSTISNQEARSRLLTRVDPEHAYLVSQLRLVCFGTTKASAFAAVEGRVRAQVWALDQEIASAQALKEELVARIARVQRLRSELAAVLVDIATDDVITRVPA